MEPQQNATKPATPQDEAIVPVPYSQLNYIQRSYIDWKALNGVITDDEGIRKMSLTELAAMLKVERSTIYRAMEKVPNLWDLVEERLRELAPRARLAKVHETWYLKAAKGDFQHMQLWLANFDPNFRMPTEKVQHELGNTWAELMKRKRERNIIEAEVTDEATDQPG